MFLCRFYSLAHSSLKIRGEFGEHSSLPLSAPSFPFSNCAQPDRLTFEFPVISFTNFLWIAHIKNNNVWLGRTETLAFHSSRGTVYLHVAHHSTWITLSNLGFLVGSWSAQWLLALCSPGSSSFVMEMKLGPSLGSKGENRQQQIEPDPWPSSKASSGDVIRGKKIPGSEKEGSPF